MIKIILFLIVIGICFNILKKVFKTITSFFKVLLVIGILVLSIKFYKITIPIIIVSIVCNQISKRKNNKIIKEWIDEKSPSMTEYQVDDILRPNVTKILNSDKNKAEYKFDCYSIPYGRVNAFLNYFEKSIYSEEIYYFSPICSMNSDEIREYGIVITRSGIYISKQTSDNNKESANSKEITISFAGLWKTELLENKLVIYYINIQKATVSEVEINQSTTTVPLKSIREICDEVCKSKISQAFCKETIHSSDNIEQEFTEKINISEQKFNKNQTVVSTENIATVAGVMGANESFQTQYSETKNFMNGIRGNGYAAEYANNTFDKLRGKDVVNAAQKLDESGRQVKHGADRIVNGQNIQTKYYKTASESIGAAFENKKAIYLNSDGTMMQIEVPRDQYNEACKIMQKRIDSGQVPNVQPGDDARKYVRKGYFIYAQSFNVCKAGTIESLTVDALNGAICSTIAGGVSAAIVFAIAIWNGQDVEDAAKAGIHTGLKVLGKGTMIYTLTMQLSREQVANPFIKEYTKDGVYKGLAGVNNPVFTLSENISKRINSSSIANTSLGRAMGLPKLTGKAVISGGLTTVIIFGPDICRALSGRISTKQLFKNATIGVSGIGASVLGQALIPIPIVGSVVGGMVGGFVSKRVLDSFVEDDAKEMFQILKEEFLDVVMLSNLSKEEFDEVVNKTLCNKDLSKMLREMYSSNEYRSFAREAIVSTAVINVYAKREHITNNMVDAGYQKILLGVA